MTLSELDEVIADCTKRLREGPPFQREKYERAPAFQCRQESWRRTVKNFRWFCLQARKHYQQELLDDYV